MSVFWVEVGEIEATDCEDLAAVARYLYQAGVVPPLQRNHVSRYCLAGADWEGNADHNRIEVGRSETSDSPWQRLTNDEVNELNTNLVRCMDQDFAVDADEIVEPEVDEEEDRREAIEGCYYADPQHCNGKLWECRTCHEAYCGHHWHQTDRGTKVECVSCERTRTERENPNGSNRG